MCNLIIENLLGNKALAKGIVKLSLSLFFLAFLGFFMFKFMPVFAENIATIWTDKADYAPEETVLISGSGFNPFSTVNIQVTRPDAWVDICPVDGEHGKCYDLPTTDEFGSFSNYAYILDGILGTYYIDANDGTNFAQTTFTDDVCSNIACTIDDNCTNQCDGSYWYYDDGDCSSSCKIGSTKYCKYDHRVCADSDSSDGYPNKGGSVRTCGAACDQDLDCPNVCDGTKTKTGDCSSSSCTCGIHSAACLKDSCGATCDSDTYCKCLGPKWAPSAACSSSSCSCNNQENAACKVGKCGASCEDNDDCSGGKTCNLETCQCETTHVCGNGVLESGEQCDDGNTNNGDCCSSTCQYESSSTVCRASAGACDVADFCTGSSASCPADTIQPNGYVCVVETGQCDADDTCDGTTKDCNEIYADQGTSCNDGLFCNVGETCNGAGACTGGSAKDCSSNNILGIATCNNDPDDVYYTWDSRDPFTSTCNEDTDSCPTGSETITHTCDKINCGADCDVQNSCQNKCIGNVRYFGGSCTSGCTCSFSSTENCDIHDCTPPSVFTCVGVGTNEIKETGDDYSCSGGACGIVGTKDCSVTWTCDATNECELQSCGGSDKECYYDSNYKWGTTPATETSCSDGHDNDCDGLIDCADFDCISDSNCYQRPCGTGTDICTWNRVLPLGSPNCCGCNLGYNTLWPVHTTTSATCTFNADTIEKQNLYISINNDVIQCTLNGNVIFSNAQHEGCAPADPRNGYTINLDTTNYVTSGTNTIVCDVSDDVEDPGPNNMDHFDACVVEAACFQNSDCNDDNECTNDVCVNPGQSNALCQNTNKADGTVCGSAPIGDCDSQDTCLTGKCSDNVESSGTVCRDVAGICDVAEVCDGSSKLCPADSFLPAQTECRASAGICDIAEFCTGTGAACPADSVQPASYECRGVTGVCDVAENCDGTNKACPTDTFKSSTEVCRESGGVCDLEEKCTGTSVSCPSDAKSTAVCRPAVDVCDLAESCDGTNNDCPATDAKAPLSTPCDDGLFCSATDHCDGNGICVQLTPMDCSGNNIAGIDRCDDPSDSNPYTLDLRRPFTSTCDEDANICTTGDPTIAHACDKIRCSAPCELGDQGNKCLPDGTTVLTCINGNSYNYRENDICTASCTWDECQTKYVIYGDPKCNVTLTSPSCASNPFSLNCIPPKPTFTIPTFTIPTFTAPTFTIPTFTTPTFTKPTFTFPTFRR